MASLSRKTLVLAAGTAVQSILTQVAVNLFLVRMFETQELFGMFRQAWLVVSTGVPVFLVGIDLSLYYFYSRLKPEERRTFVLRSMGILVCCGVFLGLLVAVLARPLAQAFSAPGLALPFVALSPFMALSLPATLLFNFLVVEDRPLRATILNTSILLVQSAVLIGMVAAGFSLTRVFSGLSIFAALRLAFSVVEVARHTTGPAFGGTSVRLWEQIRWGLPVGTTAQIPVLASRLDKFVVAGFMNPVSYGLYSVGALEFPIIILFAGAAATVMRIRISELHHRGEVKEVHRFYLAVFRKLALVVIPLSLALAVLAPELIEILFTRQYVGAAGVFRIYLLLAVFRLAPLEAVLSSMGRTRIVLIGGIGFLMIDLLLCILSVRPMGLLGPPTATVLSAGIVSFYYAYHTGRCLSVPLRALVPWPAVMRILGLAVVAALPAMLVKTADWAPVWVLVGGGAAYGGTFLVLALFTGTLTREDLSALRLSTGSRMGGEGRDRDPA